MTAPPVRDADEILVGFTRALRAAGVPVTQDRTHGYLAAVALVGLGDARAVYDAGRATLCSSPDDLARYDQVHRAYFNGRDGLPRARQAQAGVPSYSGLPLSEDGLEAAPDDADAEVARAMASDVEVLRHRDIGELTAAEKHRLNALFASLRCEPASAASTAAPAPCCASALKWTPMGAIVPTTTAASVNNDR